MTSPDLANQFVVDDEGDGADDDNDFVIKFQEDDGSPSTLVSPDFGQVSIDPDGDAMPGGATVIEAPPIRFWDAGGVPTLDPAQIATMVIDSNMDGEFDTDEDAHVQFQDAAGDPVTVSDPDFHHVHVDSDGGNNPAENNVP